MYLNKKAYLLLILFASLTVVKIANGAFYGEHFKPGDFNETHLEKYIPNILLGLYKKGPSNASKCVFADYTKSTFFPLNNSNTLLLPTYDSANKVIEIITLDPESTGNEKIIIGGEKYTVKALDPNQDNISESEKVTAMIKLLTNDTYRIIVQEFNTEMDGEDHNIEKSLDNHIERLQIYDNFLLNNQ
jgi:hypothetical protein